MRYAIVIPIYERVNLLDVAAPHEMFGWWSSYDCSREIDIVIAAETKGVVSTFSPSAQGKPAKSGLKIVAEATFAEIDKVDLLWVPGGAPDALLEQMKRPTFMGFLNRAAQDASYVTSVCEGALLLAHAGLLDGFKATTHWAFLECLARYPRVQVVPDPKASQPTFPRFVVDDHNGTITKGIRVTGGGISSGLDESLELVCRIAGPDVAKVVQTTTQYFPKPPVHAKDPEFMHCPLKDFAP